MATERVALTEDHRDFVDHLVATGRFPTAEAVVAQAIAILLEDEMEWQVFLDRINKAHDEAKGIPTAAGIDAETAAVRRAFRQARRSYTARGHDGQHQDTPEDAS